MITKMDCENFSFSVLQQLWWASCSFDTITRTVVIWEKVESLLYSAGGSSNCMF